MSSAPVVAIVLCALMAATGASGTRYTFYRNMSVERRVFGAEPAKLQAYGAACALLDRYWAVRCSAAALTPYWALTTAHCATPRVAYVKYNSIRPSSTDGDVAPVLLLYTHPGYRSFEWHRYTVRRDADGVSALHHDVGLVCTRTAMKLIWSPSMDPLLAMRLHAPANLTGKEVLELGFGRTGRHALSEELLRVRLRTVSCARGSWLHCVCAVSEGDMVRGSHGICSADSGGPVLFRGVQVGVTSMGPVQCATARSAAPLPRDAVVVFTALHPYASLIFAIINETDSSLAKRRLASASGVDAIPRPCFDMFLHPFFIFILTIHLFSS